MTNLITITDITDFKPLSINTDVTKKLNTFIGEAQEFDLRPLLGDALYIALVNDFIASPSLTQYNDIFNSKTYVHDDITYQHDGLRAVLVYFSYARYLAHVNTNQTAFGAVIKLTPDSQPIDFKTLARMISQNLSGAKAYETRVFDFIRRNPEDYPLYKCSVPNKRTGGLRITAIRK